MNVWWNQRFLEDRRCYGIYICPKCKRRWMSGNSWSSFGQKCTKCKFAFVLPLRQAPLDEPDGLDKSDPKKAHHRDLCQKCIALGRFCGKTDDD